MSITFSSCFYILQSKFDSDTYISWMNNFISIVNNFNLVIYTNKHSSQYIDTKNNPRIKVIIKPIKQFYNYKYKKYWIHNHTNNHLMNGNIKHATDWKLNMLWSEKIWFVNETINNKYYDTEFYGWCDIGYFRNRNDGPPYNDLHTSYLTTWPNNDTIAQMNKDKIYYACINTSYINYLHKLVNDKLNNEVPKTPIPPIQNTIAGGFFILHKSKIDWWKNTYDSKLSVYFKHNYLVKDDQIILIDCVLSDLNHFQLCIENNRLYDNWFMFQRLLK